MSALGHVALVSLEPWNEIWRRNQHLAARLVRCGHAERLTFVNPPARSPVPAFSPEPGVVVLTPRLRLPKRLGGLRDVGRRLRRRTADADVLWVNDPTVGRHALSPRQPAVYDVTDDWRAAEQETRIRRRIVRAEDVLARRAHTVVCSAVLADRWRSRYGVQPTLVPNGVDLAAMKIAERIGLQGPAPHAGYVGTLHAWRLDIGLIEQVASLPDLGTLHLVGPDCLDAASRARLQAQPRVRLEGPVAAADVPRWLRSLDVLVCPHRLTAFTLSLDAIKAYEYLASGRPVVATPTSGFQNVTAPGVEVTAHDFPQSVGRALLEPPDAGPRGAVDWADRTAAFADALRRVRGA